MIGLEVRAGAEATLAAIASPRPTRLTVAAGRTKGDPTGQGVNRRKSARRLQKRLTAAEVRVKRLFRAVPKTRRRETPLPNKAETIYDYQLTAEGTQALEQAVREVVADELLETPLDQMPPRWWWQEEIELPYRQGTAEETVEFNALVLAAIAAAGVGRPLALQPLDVGEVLRSQEYLGALQHVYVRNFGAVKTLSDRTAGQVAGEINRGMSAGNTPTEIAEAITKRFDVSRSDAQRLAVTEVNQAYNDGRMDAVDLAADRTGLRAGVLHISALLVTTRTGHAERHGNAYTTAQQRKWWDTGANRINCHCSTRAVLIDRRGRVIDTELQEEVQAEREFFDS